MLNYVYNTLEVSEWVNTGLTSNQQQGHTETRPRFKVPSGERPEKWEIDLAITGSVVKRVIHYTTAAPTEIYILQNDYIVYLIDRSVLMWILHLLNVET